MHSTGRWIWLNFFKTSVNDGLAKSSFINRFHLSFNGRMSPNTSSDFSILSTIFVIHISTNWTPYASLIAGEKFNKLLTVSKNNSYHQAIAALHYVCRFDWKASVAHIVPSCIRRAAHVQMWTFNQFRFLTSISPQSATKRRQTLTKIVLHVNFSVSGGAPGSLPGFIVVFSKPRPWQKQIVTIGRCIQTLVSPWTI